MTRFAVAAAAFLALFVVVANEANALTATTRQCISRERRSSRDFLKTARLAEQSALNQRVVGCFGPGADCAQRCQLGQAGCQKPFKEAQEKCVEDDNNQGVDDPNFTSCGDAFDEAMNGDADTVACRDIPDDSEALQCATNARLARFACTQACAAAQVANLDACNVDYGDCIQGCASKPIVR